MRNLFFATLAVATTGAFACPNLAGNYTCTYSDGPEQVAVSQTLAGGVTTYTYNGQQMIADGKSHDLDNSDIDGTYTATCAGTRVTAHLVGQIMSQGQAVGSADLTLKVDQVRAGLALDQTGTITVQGQVNPINEQVSCTKN